MRLPAPRPSVIFRQLPDGAVLYCSESWSEPLKVDTERAMD